MKGNSKVLVLPLPFSVTVEVVKQVGPEVSFVGVVAITLWSHSIGYFIDVEWSKQLNWSSS